MMGSLDRQGSDEDPTPSAWVPRDVPCSSTETSYGTTTTLTSEEDNSLFVPETPSPVTQSKRPLCECDSDCSRSKRLCWSSTGEEETASLPPLCSDSESSGKSLTEDMNSLMRNNSTAPSSSSESSMLGATTSPSTEGEDEEETIPAVSRPNHSFGRTILLSSDDSDLDLVLSSPHAGSSPGSTTSSSAIPPTRNRTSRTASRDRVVRVFPLTSSSSSERIGGTAFHSRRLRQRVFAGKKHSRGRDESSSPGSTCRPSEPEPIPLQTDMTSPHSPRRSRVFSSRRYHHVSPRARLEERTTNQGQTQQRHAPSANVFSGSPTFRRDDPGRRPLTRSASQGRRVVQPSSPQNRENYVRSLPDVFDADSDESTEFFTASSSPSESEDRRRAGTPPPNSENSPRPIFTGGDGGRRGEGRLRRRSRLATNCMLNNNSDDEIRTRFPGFSLVTFPTSPGRRQRRGTRSRRRRLSSEREISSPDPVLQVQQMEEDERMARMLQVLHSGAQFDAEVQVQPAPILPESEEDVNITVDRDTSEGSSETSLSSSSSASSRQEIVAQAYVRRSRRNAASNWRRRGTSQRSWHSPRINLRHPGTHIHTLPILNLVAFSVAQEEYDYEELWNIIQTAGDVMPRGLLSHQLNRLPTRKYGGEDEVKSKECLVCLSEFEKQDLLRILPCFHEFHAACIDKWLPTNRTCPVCRAEVEID